ncbi:HAD family hydrolase [Deinococcus marmoris]|uniref:HAD family hydrolase n=1 Tax=Deinococcus marmoris TaxID=249408 RepID=UPI000496612F|nr:HAD family hydrolase [Deinococcus marmoris]
MKAVLFDLDGTLHDRNATAQHWLEGHVQRFDLPPTYAARFLELDDFGYRPKSEVMPLLVREFGLAYPAQALLDDFSAHFMAAPVPMPHAHAVLAQLRERGLRIGVVTNGWPEVQTACLEGCGLMALVDDVVISKVVGLSKPDPAIYRLALQRLGVTAANTLFVGDSPRNDIIGPQAVGLRTAFLPTGHALSGEKPDAVLGDLRDVLTLA